MRYQACSLVATISRSLLSLYSLVADEVDARHQRRIAFLDLVDHVDAVLVLLDQLRLDAGGEAAAAGIEFLDALAVGLHRLRREDRAAAHLHLAAQHVVGDLAVALEGHPIDDRVLLHLDDHAAALAADLHVAEQAGGEQRLQAAVEPVGIEGVARLQQHVGADGIGLDPLVAADVDRLNGALRSRRRRGAARAGCGRGVCASASRAAGPASGRRWQAGGREGKGTSCGPVQLGIAGGAAE